MPDTTAPAVENLQEQLRAEQESNLLAQEAIADLTMQLEDRGWRALSHGVADEFTADGRRRVAAACRTMAVSNPLVKRGLQLRIGYIWGQGLEVAAQVRDDEALQAQVNDLLADFETDNDRSLTGSQAQEELERALGTDGNVFLACFTSPLVGRVQVRSTPTDEIVDIITNPDDRDDPWFYVREYVETTLEAGYGTGTTRARRQTRKVVHPALGYRPATRIKSLNGHEVRWDAPILHVSVNRLDGWQYGVPDAYVAIAYARMYRDFLVDWAGLTKALSKIAYKMTGDTRSRAARAASSARAAAAASPDGLAGAGQAAVLGPGQGLEAVSKSGATIDSQSGKPLAAMVAAGMGVPVTMLLADPGVSGARATAETLDRPTILEMGMRRLLWQAAFERIVRHVITAAVEAPRGRLTGTTLVDDWGLKHTILGGGVEPTLDFTWPPLADLDPVKLVEAIVNADGTGKVPPLTTVRLLLNALGVKDVDEVMKKVTDEDGAFIDPEATAGDAAAQRFRRGQDPTGAL
ncbi:hypothetical protein [Nocardioides lacusdianchii]|uniref:hypothetical protein n=1 Tax=Nocardioides lacusdianchii TaxID=2783664 RepID=UPI001CCA7DEA|nr:hypothetical protein [Nocardioides lacusdianchii]